MFNMSLNCGLSRLNGKLPANFKVFKGRELLHRSKFVGGWKFIAAILWVLGMVGFGFLCFLYGLRVGLLKAQGGRAMEVAEALKNNGLFPSNFNLSQEKIHAFPDQYKACPREIEDFSLQSYQNSFNCSVQPCWWVLVGMSIMAALRYFQLDIIFHSRRKWKLAKPQQVKTAQKQEHQLQKSQSILLNKQLQAAQNTSKGMGKWRKKFLVLFVVLGVFLSLWLFYHMHQDISLRRKETLTNMCDERARMLQDQFNVSMNHVNALAILVSTFHHGKNPSAIDQKTFAEYTDRTAFERPLTSGVAYALRIVHSKREEFEKQQGWTIKEMETGDQKLVEDCSPEERDPAPVKDEYAPVIFTQRTVAHIVSIDMMSGKEDHDNILRARATGKGVLTSPFPLLKSNHLGVVLTFAVYDKVLPPEATSAQRIAATVGYLGASYDVPSQVEKLLQQLASKQKIIVNVYDTTNVSAPITMYGPDAVDTGLLHVSPLDFGDPLRSHEMQCRFKHKPPPPWTAIMASGGVLIITLLLGHIFHAAINRIAQVEEDYHEMMELKARAEAADVAKSQFLATVSHEIRTPVNGVLGMLQMLMDTDLDLNQMDLAQTAHASGKDLISLINEVLDQAKIESGKLDLEAVPFDLRYVLDNVLSLFSGKSHEKGIELAVYVSSQVPEVVIGDPGRFRQIITNLVGNSVKFTKNQGHIFVSVHLAEEVSCPSDMMDEVLRQSFDASVSGSESSERSFNTLSGLQVVDRRKSWSNFKQLASNTDISKESNANIKILVTVEDTGVGILREAQGRVFTPFMQADSSTSRTYGGTGIGLSISKCLVALMEGEIGFVSEPDVGSTFSFTAVLAKGEPNPITDPDAPNGEAALSEFKGLRALVVDRRSIRAEVTRYHLQRLKVSVDVPSTLGLAVSYLDSNCNASSSKPLSLILIDKDSWEEPTITLRDKFGNGRSRSEIPKIFLLATSTNTADKIKLKATGLIDEMITKPLRLSVLVSCFQEAFADGRRLLRRRAKPANLGTLLKGKKILVVDDNRVNRRVAEGALKKYGAVVTCVDSGKAALIKLEPPHSFDACFMDLQMPEMDGFEATRRIRQMESNINERIESGEETSTSAINNGACWHTRILAMTADVIRATNEECLKHGMDGYVAKPFEEEQLYSAVACFFESD